MIEKFSKEELEQIIKELQETGLTVKDNPKNRVITEEAVKVLGGRPFITSDIRKAINILADFVTDNYERKDCKNGKYQKRALTTISKEKEDDYRKVARGIFETLKPYYGEKDGFCNNPRSIDEWRAERNKRLEKEAAKNGET